MDGEPWIFLIDDLAMSPDAFDRVKVGLRMLFAQELPPGVEVDAIWGLAGRQKLLVRKLTHRRDTLEEIFLKAMGHLAQTPGEGAARDLEPNVTAS